MDDRNAPLLDILAPAPEPPRIGWLAWGAVAGTVAFAGLAVAVAVWTMAPLRGRGAAAPEPATLASSPATAAQKPSEHAPGEPTGTPDVREAVPLTSRELADLAAELPASWRAGVSLTLPEADPWIMPDLPFVEAPPPPAEPAPPLHKPEPPASAGARPTTAPDRARPAAVARTSKARPVETAGNTARCRGAVAAAQIGETLSQTDLAFMRAGCAE